MTYNVFAGTLSLTQSTNRGFWILKIAVHTVNCYEEIQHCIATRKYTQGNPDVKIIYLLASVHVSFGGASEVCIFPVRTFLLL